MPQEITYLLANYNNGRYIEDCIDSLHAQTDPNWRCLIIDDRSTDDSLSIITPLLCDKIKLLVNEQNVGYTPTLIRLIDEAETELVGILDPDDALYPEATELVLKAYRENPEVGFVYSKQDYFDATLQTRLKTSLSAAIPPGGTALHGYVTHLKTFRRSAYAQTAGYDPAILYAEDQDLIYKMDEATPFFFVDHVLYKYRQLADSQSKATKKRWIGMRSHRQAYYQALRRRNITGVRKAGFLLWFAGQQLAYALVPYPFAHRIASRTFVRVLVKAGLVLAPRRP